MEADLSARRIHCLFEGFTACSEGHTLSFFNSFLIMPKAGMLGKLFVIRRAARIGRVVWMAGGFGGGRTRFKLWGVIKGTMNGTVIETVKGTMNGVSNGLLLFTGF